MLRRFEMVKRLLHEMGVEPKRVRLEWISAAEGEKVKHVVNEMVEQVRQLGPLTLPQRFEAWDHELAGLEAAVADEPVPANEPCPALSL